MNTMFLDVYIKVSILIAFVDVVLAKKSFQKNKTTGRFLGYACMGAAVVDISYLVSILYDEYLCMSVMSSIYFVTIDIMLLCLLVFTVYFTKGKFTRIGKILLVLAALYTIFEIVVFTINPFYEIAVHYVRRNTLIAKYSYQMQSLYIMHLLFTYMLVVTVLILLMRKMWRIPREYRGQYRYVILGILAIVSVNVVFLFWPEESVYSLLDYSICGYSLTAFLLYYLPSDTKTKDDSFSLQCYVKNSENVRPLRCDIRSLKNQKGQRLGQLFVFSDAALETDLLTGFQNWESFQLFVNSNQNAFPHPTAVAVCDINSLSVINSTMGNQAGDRQIKLLADTMRQCFPKQTYYVRGVEAVLIALCSHSNESQMQASMAQVKEKFSGKLQYAISSITEENPDILQAILTASKAMRTKKLLDRESIHSEMWWMPMTP